jgi:hypothetical protein
MKNAQREEVSVGIETDDQTDLALEPEDAENIVGGAKKAKKKHTAAHHSSTPAVTSVIVSGSPVTDTGPNPNAVDLTQDPNYDPDC